eukprot:Skav211758  [mRNA]  locus=scaffold674:102840:104471:+ [translate_table: standard]
MELPSLNALCGAPCCQGPGTADATTADVIGRLVAEQKPVELSEQLGPVDQEITGMKQPARNSIRFNKMTNLQHMEIDKEVTRGIALHQALRCSELWTSPQEIRRKNRIAEVWKLSKRVSSLDIFLSHTWRTKGRWKVLALMMQTGWLHGLLGWSIGLAIMLCLRGFELLSDPWQMDFLAGGHRRSTSLSVWTVPVAELFLLIGLYFSPYLPFKTQMGFYDAACIHQGHGEMFERGIYGIGGFLTVSKELRVLYTSQYLSSLWCVFELVGFRKVHPEGKVNFCPLFMERSTLVCALIVFCNVFSLNFAAVYTEEEIRESYFALGYVFAFFPPWIFLAHTLRFNYREKRRLIFDLNTFNVDNLICTLDSDRDFILSAIEAWYGNKEAFNVFVRNDLRAELLGLLPSPHLHWTYAALILSSQVAVILDTSLSLQKAGFEGHTVLRYCISGLALSILWSWCAFNGFFYLSDRSAGSARSYLLDWCKTLAVAGVTFVFTLIAFVLWIQVVRSNRVLDIVCFTAFPLLFPCFFSNIFPTCRHQRGTGNQ